MIRSIDHIDDGLTSSDIDKTVHFYCSVLGMKLDRFTPADGKSGTAGFIFKGTKNKPSSRKSPYIPRMLAIQFQGRLISVSCPISPWTNGLKG